MKLSMILSQLSTGMAGTISIFVLTLVFSLPLGLLIAFGRMSKNRIVSGIFRLYISLMRGTPLMLQLMVVYFGPFYLFGMNIGKWRFPAIITGFALNYGAYFAEIYRSGIVSMDRGQYEAAKLLGYSKGQTFVRIILPQVVKRILPAITNEVIRWSRIRRWPFPFPMWKCSRSQNRSRRPRPRWFRSSPPVFSTTSSILSWRG